MLELRLAAVNITLNGNNSLKKREFEVLPGINERMGLATWSSWYSTNATTGIQKQDLEIVRNAIPEMNKELMEIEIDVDNIKAYFYSVGGTTLKND